jgi:hypothetical protein
MIIEVHEDLHILHFEVNAKAVKNLSPNSIIDTVRDFAYTANVNPLKEGLLDLTVYITQQERDSDIMLVSYVGLVKAFLIDVYNIDNDKIDLFDFIEQYAGIAYQTVKGHKDSPNIILNNPLSTPTLCDKIIESLKRLGFYK